MREPRPTCELALNLLEWHVVNRSKATSPWRKLAAPWLAGALVLLLVALALGSVTHCDHGVRHAHPDCAACSMAHGGVLANGASGATVIISSSALDLPKLGEFQAAVLVDLRLTPGRAPPV